MVQLYSPGDANAPCHVGTLAPPGKYDWTCASFGPPESTTQTANRSAQPFLHSSQQCVVRHVRACPFPSILPLPTRYLDPHPIHGSLSLPKPTLKRHLDRFSHFCTAHVSECRWAFQGMAFPLKIAPSYGDRNPHLICGSFGPWGSASQTASRSAQPFLHNHGRQSLYFTMGPLFPKIAPSHGEIWTPSNIWLLWPTEAHNANGIWIRSAVFAQLTAEWPYTLQRAAPSTFKIAPYHGRSLPHLIILPWAPRVLNQNGISIGSAILVGFTSVTDKPTNRSRY